MCHTPSQMRLCIPSCLTSNGLAAHLCTALLPPFTYVSKQYVRISLHTDFHSRAESMPYSPYANALGSDALLFAVGFTSTPILSVYLLIPSTCHGCHDSIIVKQHPLLFLDSSVLSLSRPVLTFFLSWSLSPAGSSAALRLRHALRRSFPSWDHCSSSAATCTCHTFDVPQLDSSFTLPGAMLSPMLRRSCPSLQSLLLQ